MTGASGFRTSVAVTTKRSPDTNHLRHHVYTLQTNREAKSEGIESAQVWYLTRVTTISTQTVESLSAIYGLICSSGTRNWSNNTNMKCREVWLALGNLHSPVRKQGHGKNLSRKQSSLWSVILHHSLMVCSANKQSPVLLLTNGAEVCCSFTPTCSTGLAMGTV